MSFVSCCPVLPAVSGLTTDTTSAVYTFAAIDTPQVLDGISQRLGVVGGSAAPMTISATFVGTAFRDNIPSKLDLRVQLHIVDAVSGAVLETPVGVAPKVTSGVGVYDPLVVSGTWALAVPGIYTLDVRVSAVTADQLPAPVTISGELNTLILRR